MSSVSSAWSPPSGGRAGGWSAIYKPPRSNYSSWRRSLKELGWALPLPGRKRNTIVHCHAGCTQENLIAHFHSQGWSLHPLAAANPRATPHAMLRALRLCSTSERRIFDALQARGDGPATYWQLAPYTGGNRNAVARAIRGLEFLGLLRVERGRPYWSEPDGWEKGRKVNPTNIYAVAGKRLFRALDDDDAAVLADLREVRNSERRATLVYARQKVGPKHGSIGFDTVYVKGKEGVEDGGRAAVGCGENRPGDEGLDRPPPTGPMRGKPARAVRAFAATCAELASGGRWAGGAHELLVSIRPPAGERSWPRNSRTLNVWLWMARADMAALGCKLTREWPEAGQRLVLTIDRAPGLVQGAERVEPPPMTTLPSVFGRVPIDQPWAQPLRAFATASRQAGNRGCLRAWPKAAAQGRIRPRSLRRPILAWPAPPHAHDDDRLRLPAKPPPRRGERGKKIRQGPPKPTLPAIRRAVLAILARAPPYQCPPLQANLPKTPRINLPK